MPSTHRTREATATVASPQSTFSYLPHRSVAVKAVGLTPQQRAQRRIQLAGAGLTAREWEAFADIAFRYFRSECRRLAAPDRCIQISNLWRGGHGKSVFGQRFHG